MQRRAPAFTLLEMIVVLAIATLIIGIGAAAVMQLTETNELRRTAHDAEHVLMQAMTQAAATAQVQHVDLAQLGGKHLTVRHAGADEFQSVEGARLVLRPGGLCEPLTLRWQRGEAWIAATLDPLTAAFAELEESP